jgi:hypothetical protein
MRIGKDRFKRTVIFSISMDRELYDELSSMFNMENRSKIICDLVRYAIEDIKTTLEKTRGDA